MRSASVARSLAPLLAALACRAPTDAAAAEPGALIVLNKSDATAMVIDADARGALHTVPTGVGPHEVAVSPDGALAIVANYGAREPGRTLTVIDAARGEVERTIDLGEHTRPHGILFEDEGRVLVTTEGSRSLLRVDVVAGRVADVFRTDQEVSHMVALAPDRRRAFVANIGSGTVTAIDLASGRVAKQIACGAGTEAIDVTPDGREVWAGNRAADTLSVIDARSLDVVATLSCAKFPIRIKFTPDGRHALVSCAQSGDVAVFDVAERREVRRIAMGISAAENASGRLLDFGESPVPIGILIRPDGERAYVANTNADIVTEIDLSTWSIVARVATGREPDGLAWSRIRTMASAR
jgi:YVTN family beta-propeller protein